MLELIAERCQALPDAPVTYGWNGDFMYGELDRPSSVLAACLAEGVRAAVVRTDAVGDGGDATSGEGRRGVWAAGPVAPAEAAAGHPTGRDGERLRCHSTPVMVSRSLCACFVTSSHLLANGGVVLELAAEFIERPRTVRQSPPYPRVSPFAWGAKFLGNSGWQCILSFDRVGQQPWRFGSPELHSSGERRLECQSSAL